DAWATRTLWVGVKAGGVLTTDIAKLFDFMSAR
ncbi:GntR family transcriptional regulator, partial [Escherichia coli]|nr:GntR family transcriptional regulator [Escherichia coli]